MESLCALVDGVGEVMRLVVSVQTRPRPTRDPLLRQHGGFCFDELLGRAKNKSRQTHLTISNMFLISS